MSEVIKKTENYREHVRCTKCNKLLAKSLSSKHLEIKCARCGALTIAFEKNLDQIIITDPKGKILYINEATEKATGYNSTEAIGHKPSDLWGNIMSLEFYKNMWRVIKKEKKIFQGLILNKRKNGEQYEVKLIVSPILDNKRSVMFYVGTEIIIKKST
ncbi:MAG: PAS domain S-box protein [Candidatus Paceibacterota bacterium]|jgi:PAS domain S-box-containing protein